MRSAPRRASTRRNEVTRSAFGNVQERARAPQRGAQPIRTRSLWLSVSGRRARRECWQSRHVAALSRRPGDGDSQSGHQEVGHVLARSADLSAPRRRRGITEAAPSVEQRQPTGRRGRTRSTARNTIESRPHPRRPARREPWRGRRRARVRRRVERWRRTRRVPTHAQRSADSTSRHVAIS